MPSSRDVRPFERGGERSELVPLVRRIQALTLEVQELKLRRGDVRKLHAKERTLEPCAGDWRPSPDAPPTTSTPPLDDRRGVDDRKSIRAGVHRSFAPARMLLPRAWPSDRSARRSLQP